MNQKAILISLVVILLATGGVLYYATTQKEQGAQEIDTSGWLTYRSEAFGITFNYPPEFKVIESSFYPGSIIINAEPLKGEYSGSAVSLSMQFSYHGFPGIGLEGAVKALAMESGTFKPALIGKDKTINALERISSNGDLSYYVFLKETKQVSVGSGFLNATAFSISDSFNFHKERLETDGMYSFYKTNFDEILQSLELLFSELSISENELKVSNLPITSFTSEQEALTIVKQQGFNTDVPGITIELKPFNRIFFSSYSGPGSPIRIQGQYWEIRIPVTTGPECWASQVIFIDAQTGELYDLGKSEVCN